MDVDRTDPWVASNAAELLDAVSDLVEIFPDDGKSGSRFHRGRLDGDPVFVKALSHSTDWISRVIGDTELWPLKVWAGGLMLAVPPQIDTATIGMAVDGAGEEAVLTLLLHDIGPWLVPEGDDAVPLDHHADFLDGLAALSSATWGWTDSIGLCSFSQRLRMFSPDRIAPELARHWPDGVPGPIAAADVGWARLADRRPEWRALAAALHDDPGPLERALASTPRCFLHGDWKMGNLGHHDDGRTILLDWAYPGAGPPGWDLAWYLSLNAARLPESKEAAIDRFRRCLESRSIETSDWFDDQIALSLLANAVTFGWEKALGSEHELAWWDDAVRAGVRLL